MDFATVYGWAIDFLRAYSERPWIFKIFARLIFGKYAYREFIGMIDASQAQLAYFFSIGYSLQDMDYHKDKPRLIWWNDPKDDESK